MLPQTDDQLDWMAQQYVLGDLPAAETESFELRLANDLKACEAVAAASILVQGIRIAREDGRIVTSANPRKSSGFAKVVVAASLLIAMGVIWQVSNRTIVSNDKSNAVELVSQWRSDSTVDTNDVDDMDDDTELAAELEVPTWLIAGVSLEQDSNERKDN